MAEVVKSESRSQGIKTGLGLARARIHAHKDLANFARTAKSMNAAGWTQTGWLAGWLRAGNASITCVTQMGPLVNPALTQKLVNPNLQDMRALKNSENSFFF